MSPQASAQDQKSTYLPRSYFGARLEPKETVLHGAGQDAASFDAYSLALGPSQSPIVYMTYLSLLDARETINHWAKDLHTQLAALPSRHVIPQIGLSFAIGKETGRADDASVAAGSWDDNIETFCIALKSLNRPALIRIGFEFDGHWNGYTPGPYKASFIRITQALRKHEVNCATIWCSGGGSAWQLHG